MGIMKDSGDPLDLLNDDGDAVIELCLLGEEEKGGKGGSRTRSGCSLVFLVLVSALLMGGWCLGRIT
jgi:hypothetical protein